MLLPAQPKALAIQEFKISRTSLSKNTFLTLNCGIDNLLDNDV